MIRLFFIGIAMGIADLIPGVSGGTIALITGIYEELLESIKTLHIQSIKNLAWPFLLPLGLGVCAAICGASRLIYTLMLNYHDPLFALFFGLIGGSVVFCSRNCDPKSLSNWSTMIVGFIAAFLLSGMASLNPVEIGTFGLLCAGMIGAFAMLLPGISGSYVLQLLGVYPFLLAALNNPGASGSFKMLVTLGVGLSLGLIVFSRGVSFLITRLKTVTYSALVGFMLGGMRAIWPFHREGLGLTLLCACCGFFLVILLEIRKKKNSPIPGL